MRLQTLHGISIPDRIRRAFSAVPRSRFLPPDAQDYAEYDSALPIGFGQTNSQPSVVAFMLTLLNPRPGNRILDVGAGSGWTTALLAHLVGERGEVVGTERVSELARSAQERIRHLRSAEIIETNEIGYPQRAPYDRILVSAEADAIDQDLIDQLAEWGTLVMPLNRAIVRIHKRPDRLEQESYEGFMFVPLL